MVEKSSSLETTFVSLLPFLPNLVHDDGGINRRIFHLSKLSRNISLGALCAPKFQFQNLPNFARHFPTFRLASLLLLPRRPSARHPLCRLPGPLWLRCWPLAPAVPSDFQQTSFSFPLLLTTYTNAAPAVYPGRAARAARPPRHPCRQPASAQRQARQGGCGARGESIILNQ